MIITLTWDESHRKNDHIHLNHHHHHHQLDFQPDQPEEDAETRKGIHNHEVKGEGGDDDDEDYDDVGDDNYEENVGLQKTLLILLECIVSCQICFGI